MGTKISNLTHVMVLVRRVSRCSAALDEFDDHTHSQDDNNDSGDEDLPLLEARKPMALQTFHSFETTPSDMKVNSPRFVYSNLLKRKEPVEDKANSTPNLFTAGDRVIPTWVYENGRVICKLCGTDVLFPDDDTGAVTLKPLSAHRNSW